MYKKIAGAVAIFFCCSAMFGIQQQEKKIEKDTSSFMKRKLTNSKNIVSGLATEDFELIEKSSQDLMLLSQEAEWKVMTTPAYLEMSRDFRASAKRVREAAKKKNLDGATLAYFEVTLSCVRCHKYIRNKKEDEKKKK